MPSFFPTFHLPKSRQKNALSPADLEVPRNLTQDFDGSEAVDSFIPRKFSVKHMPEIPAYNKKTGQVLRGKRVQSMPNALGPPLPAYHKSDIYTFNKQNSQAIPPPVPVKEKRYSSYNSTTTSSYTYINQEQKLPYIHIAAQHQPNQLAGKNEYYRPRSFHPYDDTNNTYGRTDHAGDISSPPKTQTTHVDCGTIGSSLNHSSTFEKAPLNDSRSSVNSGIYQHPELKTSYMSSLYNFYLQGDCASSASSIYENEEPKQEQRRAQSETMKPISTQSSYKTIDFCLDSCADYDKSRFMIPAAETLQSKRFSASQIPSSAYMKQQGSIPIRAVSELPQIPKKNPAHRWSYAHPQSTNQAIHKPEKQLPEIALAPHHHSVDSNGFNYRARMRQTLQDPNSKNKFTGSNTASTTRAISNPILQIKQILRS